MSFGKVTWMFSCFLLSVFPISQLAAQGNMNLEKCISLAITNNLSLKNAQLSLALSQQENVQSWGNFLPSLDAYGNRTYYSGFSTDPQTNQLINSQIQFDQFWITSSINLFSGLGNINSLRKTMNDVKAGESSLDHQRDQIKMQTTYQYLMVRMAMDKADFIEKQRTTAAEALEKMKLLAQNGKQSQDNVLEAEAMLANLDEQAVRARGALKASLLQLAQLIQYEKPEELSIDAGELKVPAAPASGSDTAKTSPRVMPDYLPQAKFLELNYRSAVLDRRVAWSRFSPKVSLDFGMSTFYTENSINASPAPYQTQLNNNFVRWAGVTLRVPILQNNYAYVSSRKAYIRQEIAANQLKSGTQQLQNELYYSSINADVAFKNYQASEKNLAVAEKLYNNSQSKFTLGTVTALQVSYAQNNYIAAKAGFDASKYDWIFKSMVLEYYKTGKISLAN